VTGPTTSAGVGAAFDDERRGGAVLSAVITFCLRQRLVTLILLALVIGYGVYVMPFSREGTPLEGLPSDPVPVDAIPDIGEKQQIVFTRWPGRSPQDVEDQVTYPLVARLLGVPDVKTVRASSMFGFSSIYVIFDDDADFYESRTRILEKLSSAGAELPAGAVTELGPDATALGQVFWYTLEGEGFDLHELRAIQDFTVRYALLGVPGVAEVAGVGGLQREIQVDVDPEALRAHDVRLSEVEAAVAGSNLDVGARQIELNGVEYFVRGVGFAKSPDDVASAVIRSTDGVPLTVRQVASVQSGPAPRRGALDKAGAEVVGGVVTARYGENPREVTAAIKARIEAIAPGLPKRTLDDGRVSQVRIVPFYDRSKIIDETVATLSDALVQQMLICVLVILLLLLEFRSALLVAATLPVGVLMALGFMKALGVESNIMSLGGIIIAIGTMVDLGIILSEAMVQELEQAGEADARPAIFRAANDVGSAVLTAVATTVVSFLPVFSMSGPEARLFTPLALTKTFALVASVLVGLTLLPTAASLVLKRKGHVDTRGAVLGRLLALLTLGFIFAQVSLLAAVATWALAFRAALAFIEHHTALVSSDGAEAGGPWPALVRHGDKLVVAVLGVVALLALTAAWMPLGQGVSLAGNLVFVAVVVGVWMGLLVLFLRGYPSMLRYVLAHKARFLAAPLALVLFGATVWLGAERVASPVVAVLDRVGLGGPLKASRPFVRLAHAFPGLQKEFMPPLDEGTFLYMPTVMPHAGIGEALDILQKQDIRFAAIPEVSMAVGKLGRADTPLDPAPLSMFETLIEVKPEYGPPDPETGVRPRQWREHIRSMDDIWEEIVKAGDVPGATSAPKLMPIATRIVMLQSGMRAPLGVKIKGRDLGELERVASTLEQALKSVAGVSAATVLADRVVGKPYLEIVIDRDRAARYGVRVVDAQRVIQTAVGGRTVTTTIEGRERYPVRVRYQREERDSLEAMMGALVPAAAVTRTVGPNAAPNSPAIGARPHRPHVPLSQIAELRYAPGPLAIKSEDGFLVAYVTFDRLRDAGEVEVARAAQARIDALLDDGALVLGAGMLRPEVAGTYANQVRSERTLAIVLPIALLLIVALLLLQFGRLSTTLLVFSGVVVAWGGGFTFLWLWGQLEGTSFTVFGVDLMAAFAPTDVKLSVAVWVGFIALFGIASDDGVVMATTLDAAFRERAPTSVGEVRAAVVAGGLRRIRPCLMTTATTVLALLPVLTSHGRGADVMTPMALPSVGGMLFELLTLFVVPVLYCWLAERRVVAAAPAIAEAEEKL
jgi:Cu(I)/Ag(I) efflux system membrane protein CusA/SilA